MPKRRSGEYDYHEYQDRLNVVLDAGYVAGHIVTEQCQYYRPDDTADGIEKRELAVRHFGCPGRDWYEGADHWQEVGCQHSLAAVFFIKDFCFFYVFLAKHDTVGLAE